MHCKNVQDASKPYVEHGAKVFLVDSQWMKKFKKAYFPHWLDSNYSQETDKLITKESPRKSTDGEISPGKKPKPDDIKLTELDLPPLTNERIVLSHGEVMQQSILVLSKKRAAMQKSLDPFATTDKVKNAGRQRGRSSSKS